jgi:hypothetical protein
MTVRIQVIKIFDVEAPENCEDPVEFAYRLQPTEIERTGVLVDAMSDNAEVVDVEKIGLL